MPVEQQPLPEPPWGFLLAGYFVLIGLPSGITLVSCWRRRFQPGSARTDQIATVLALALLVLAGLLLIIDLGRPTRFFLMLTRFGNLDSPIAIGAKLIAVKGFLLLADLYLLRRAQSPDGTRSLVAGDRSTRMVVAGVTWLLAAVSLALAVYPAVVLSRTWFAPLAATSGAALIFLLTSCLMGLAAHLVIDLYERVRPVTGMGSLRLATLGLLAGYVVVLGMQTLSVVGVPKLDVALSNAATGLLAWCGALTVMGVVVPAVGLAVGRTRPAAQLISATAILLGAGASRYLIFAVGG
jgi:formate-dependent nitrite reductase membrane component NrfD